MDEINKLNDLSLTKLISQYKTYTQTVGNLRHYKKYSVLILYSLKLF